MSDHLETLGTVNKNSKFKLYLDLEKDGLIQVFPAQIMLQEWRPTIKLSHETRDLYLWLGLLPV